MTTSLIVLGKIVGAHGLHGQLRVRVFGDDAENFLQATRLSVARDEEGAGARSYKVASVTPGRAGEVRLALEGVEGRGAAEELRGCFVFAELEALQELAPGEYYWHELIGCRVEDLDGVSIGTVDSLLETGAHDLLVVSGEHGEEHLIPTAARFMREVDIEGRRIVVEVIPGLLDSGKKS